MTFLPIVERELRVAARKRSTSWLRVITALVALIIGAGFLTMSVALGANSVSFGRGLFSTLTWLALIATLAAGLFLTADSVSEEKREGTLGFLFLTDLRGYDVAGGKLLATSVRSFFALLAFFPVLGITLLMGGVTGVQFWKSSLALVNALFCSLSVGLLISSLCRDSQKAMAGTLFLILLMCGGGPLVDSIISGFRRTGFGPVFTLSSPIYAFWAATAWGKTGYWAGLCLSHLVAWLAFAAACWLLPRTWQDKPGRLQDSRQVGWYRWQNRSSRLRTDRRNRLINHHPVLWLASRERWQAIGIWVLVGVVMACFAALIWILPGMGWVIWSQVSKLVVLLLYLWTTSQACRFFVDAKRSGLMEVLLVTPLSSRNIVLGQWHALLRLFALPALLLVLVQVAGVILSQQTTLGALSSTAGLPLPSLLLAVMVALAGGLSTLGNLAALAWFGMWMALNSRNANLATLRTILFVQIFPWLGISFFSITIPGLIMLRGLMGSSTRANTMALMFPMIIAGASALLTLAKDAGFIFWARGRLFASFRSEAAKAIHLRRGAAFVPKTVRSAPPPIPAQR